MFACTPPRPAFAASGWPWFLCSLCPSAADAREVLGDEVELCHDTHERVSNAQTVQLAKALEPYRMFFLEDSLRPEQGEHFQIMRQHSTVPIAMGVSCTCTQSLLPLRWC